MFDPGAYSTAQNSVKNIDIVLITHEHQDHLSMESLRTVMKNNPGVKVITNASVGEILGKENIPFEILGDHQNMIVQGVAIEGFGEKHALIHDSLPRIADTGYMIAGRFFYPGDAWHEPSRKVEILALPIVAPWMKLADALEYAQSIVPKVCFPVHDAFLKQPHPFYFLPEKFLPTKGIEFRIFEEQKEYQF